MLTDEWLQRLTDFVVHTLDSSNKRILHREENRTNEDWDEESERKLGKTNKKEIVAQNQAAEAVGRLMKIYGAR